MYQFAELPENPTKQDIQQEVKRLKNLANDHRAKDQGLKVLLNSVYGALGYYKFIVYDKKVALSITGGSRDMIQYTIRIFNDYFKKHYYEDEALMKVLGTSKMTPIIIDVINYADTDSVFIVLEAHYNQALRHGFDGKSDQADSIEGSAADSFNAFATLVSKFGINPYVERVMDEYAEHYGANSRRPTGGTSMNLELEQVCHSIVQCAKKRYIKDVSMEGRVTYDPTTNIEVKGLEINKSSSPAWVRKNLKDAVNYILASSYDPSGELTATGLSDWIRRNVKEPFYLTDMENICQIERIGKYSKYITHTEPEGLIVEKNCKPHTSGAGYYNWYLMNTPEGKILKNKYPIIQDGDRVYTYMTTHDSVHRYFSFLPGAFPHEFALPVDKERQLDRVFLGPLNNIIHPIGIDPMNHLLETSEPLF
jgi:hypothetical protein